MMPRIALIAFLISGHAMAQANGQNQSTPDPSFTFTPAHGNPIAKGHFSPGGTLSFIDLFDGKTYMIEIAKIERIVLSPPKGPGDPKCGSSSPAVVTFLDGSRQHGCIAPGPLAFVGATAVPSISGMVGKFVRDKPERFR